MQKRDPSAIKQIIIHCSDTPPEMDIGASEIREWHVKERGWDDIGYHFVIRRNGALEAGRPFEYIGAHCKGQNEDSIGICLVGGANGKFDFTFQQLDRLEMVCADLAGFGDTRWVFRIKRIAGHNEYNQQKTCPNFNVKEFFSHFTF